MENKDARCYACVELLEFDKPTITWHCPECGRTFLPAYVQGYIAALEYAPQDPTVKEEVLGIHE